MDPVTLGILSAAGQLVPSLLRWIGKDSAADMAGKVVDVARQVTGLGRDDATPADQMLAQIKADPALMAKFIESTNQLAISQLDAETRQLEAINATMREESRSEDPWVRRARPVFLYSMALTWTLQMLGLTIVIVIEPDKAADVLAAAAGLTTMWGIALTVVGVAVKARSDDKARELGMDVPPLSSALGGLLKRKPPTPIATPAPIVERGTEQQP